MAGILAAACAPAIVRADSLMKIIVPKRAAGILYRRFGNEWIAIAEVTSFSIGAVVPITPAFIGTDVIHLGGHRDIQLNFADKHGRDAACRSGTFKADIGNFQMGWSKE